MISSKHIAVSALAPLSGTGVGYSSPKIAVGEESNKADDDSDMISKLPDDILIKIISLTRTIYAVRTSILSKRWINLYKSSPTFRFNYMCDTYKPRLYRTLDCKTDTINLVNRFLHLRSGSHIEYFSLCCCVTESSKYEFQQIIDYLGRFGIKHLKLRVTCCKYTEALPLSCDFLFQMPTLRYFNLTCGYIRLSLKEPNNRYLSVETIKLTYVNVYSVGLASILSNCPKLQSLTIRDCKFPDYELHICGPNLQLKTLVIRNCRYLRKIKLYASNLVTFQFQNYNMVGLVFDYVPRLQNFHFTVTLDFVSVSHVCRTLAKDLPPQLESLTFRSNGDFNQETVPMGYNMFGNLKQLKLSLACACKSDTRSLIRFLHGSPLLKEFTLEMSPYRVCDEQCHLPGEKVGVAEFYSNPKKVEVAEFYSNPKKVEVAEFYSNLRKVEITGYWATRKELNLALYILKTAVVLEQVRINIYTKSYRTCLGHTRGGVRPGLKSTKSKHCESRERIHKELEGQAVSKTVRLIIKLKEC